MKLLSIAQSSHFFRAQFSDAGRLKVNRPALRAATFPSHQRNESHATHALR
jgi:hypothetical protein